MPATPPQRLGNPLRRLRVILGDLGQALHQEVFSRKIGVPVATVRSIEGGGRKMTKSNCLENILLRLKATWNEQTQQWHPLGIPVPYEKKHAELSFAEDPYLDDFYAHRLVERLLDLLQGCQTRDDRWALLLYLFGHLEETAQRFNSNAELGPTRPEWHYVFDPVVWGKALEREAAFVATFRDKSGKHRPISPHQNAGGIYDFRARRTFQAKNYPAETPGEADAIAQKRKHDREAAVQKTGENSGTILAPKRKTPKNRAAKKQSKKQ
jgi:hypothetical protein